MFESHPNYNAIITIPRAQVALEFILLVFPSPLIHFWTNVKNQCLYKTFLIVSRTKNSPHFG
jgi:hypothetical protein